MADPITIAVLGASAGAMMNKKDPLKGALMGGALGFGGAAGLGAMGAGGAVGTGIGAGGASLPGVMGAANAANAAALPAAISNTAVPSMIPNLLTSQTGSLVPAAGGMIQAPSALSTLSGMAGTANDFMGKNPYLTQMGLNTAQSLLSPQQQQMPQSAGLMRGSPSQVASSQYQYGTPKISLI